MTLIISKFFLHSAKRLRNKKSFFSSSFFLFTIVSLTVDKKILPYPNPLFIKKIFGGIRHRVHKVAKATLWTNSLIVNTGGQGSLCLRDASLKPLTHLCFGSTNIVEPKCRLSYAYSAVKACRTNT